jgi:hypothetical protein
MKMFFSLETEKFEKIPNDISMHPYLQPSQSKKIQNYFQFRSAEYPRITNHSNKPYLFTKKSPNSNRLYYMRNRTNMKTEEKIQEYCRYRNSTYDSPTKVSEFSNSLN